MPPKYATAFASIDSYQKGGVQIIDDNVKNFVFSNIYEVAATNPPYQRIVVAKNLDYTLEVARAEGVSAWYVCSHDEFVVAMDYSVEVHFVELADSTGVDDDKDGAIRLQGQPQGKKIGKAILNRGHMALLPEKTAYQFQSAKPATLLFQTILGQESVERWNDICLK